MDSLLWYTPARLDVEAAGRRRLVPVKVFKEKLTCRDDAVHVKGRQHFGYFYKTLNFLFNFFCLHAYSHARHRAEVLYSSTVEGDLQQILVPPQTSDLTNKTKYYYIDLI